ncbi:hypothetical protein OF83DRAFT_1102318 [Amylostereum chailletii]|nr:hypothetical protein OF83DRAFT_1102318 [Amylostereum chailletii]
MPAAIGVWSLVLEGGGPDDDPKLIIPEADVLITNVALGEEVVDENSRTTIKLSYVVPAAADSEDEQDEDGDEDDDANDVKSTVLCSLTPGKIEQVSVNITLEAESEFLFQAIGKNTVYLTGNYIDQRDFDNVPYNDESESDDEGAFALQDVSSDVEINPEDIDGIDDLSDDADRFEEIHDEPSKSTKRSRESDTLDAEALSKSQKKKAKKQKAENGSAVPSAPDSEPEPKDKKKDKKEKKEKKEKVAKEDGKDAKEDKAVLKDVGDRGLKVKDVTVGNGPQAKPGNTVSMRYIGKLTNGKIFDSNTKGKPFSFKLGKGEVIKGWDEGIKGMQVGGERLLVIPPQLGYGKAKSGPIPANSTLTFEVKLVEIK